MIRANLLILILLSVLSCSQPIKPENKIGIIGKIVEPSVARNGAKTFVYFYKSKKFLDFTSFDARYFTYGDKFLLFIDKYNPDKWEMPKPNIHLGTFEDVVKDSSIIYYKNSSDMNKLDSIPTY